MALNPEDLQIVSFATTTDQQATIGDFSWPDVCTCIDICQPSEDIRCTGAGCPPDYTV